LKEYISLLIYSFDKNHFLACTGDKLSLPTVACAEDEIAFDAAYRALDEKLGIEDSVILLQPLASYSDKTTDTYNEVWYGVLESDYGIPNDNEFVWYDISKDISSNVFDGDGVIQYVITLSKRFIK